MFLKRKTLLTCLLVSFFMLAFYVKGHSLTRWFKASYGFRIGGAMIDIADRVPTNNIKYTIGLSGGFVTDFQITKFLSIALEILYHQKGGVVPNNMGRINLHYISIPILAQFWIFRKRFAISAGIAHNFRVSANGRLINPSIKLNNDTIRLYDFGILFGISFVMFTFGDGIRLVGDLRFEFGVVDVLKEFRPELFNRTTPYFAIGLNF